MRLQLRPTLLFASILFSAFSFAQTQVLVSSTGCPGVPGACGYSPNHSVAHNGPTPTPQNGNGTLGVVYTNTACGLNYAVAKRVLGQRFTPIGSPQPAAFAISGIPAGACILKAYLWAEGSGNGAAQTANIVNPAAASSSYPMAIVGQGPDKCWGYAGSYTYRADVTPCVSGNGNYNISGILTNPPTSGNDMDGATLMVIWSDNSQPWKGTVQVDDGAIIVNGGIANYIMNFPAVCGPATNASAFMCVGDIQFNPTSWTLNGTAAPLFWSWFDLVQVATTVAVGQSTAAFNVNTGGDCFNLCVAAMYYRTTCVICSPPVLTMTATPATCSGCNGTATVSISPAGPYTYTWSPSGGTGSTATGLCAGTYTVTAVQGCNTYTASVVVPNAGGGLTLTGSQTNATCFGSCNGTTNYTVTGGTGPFTYAWSPANASTTVGATNTSSAACAGTYTLTVTDANSCTGTATITITQPPAITATQSQVNITCNGGCNGTATVVASGGNGTYTYSWAPSGGTAATATGLCAGTYTCTISSPAGCTIIKTFTITQPTAITATTSFVSATCGNNNGSATVTPSGGTPGYTFLWTPTGQTTQTATGLFAGAYTCLITDLNGCTMTASVTVTNSTSPTVSVSSFTNVTCNGACDGTITVLGAGGLAPYTYAWTPSGGTGSTANALCPAVYTCTLTDANGCIATTTQTITEPPALAIASSQVDLLCNGVCNGSATVGVTGGTPGYTYLWSPSGGTGATATALCAGNYSCLVTDLNGCTLTQTFTITEPTLLTVASAGFNVTCFGVCDGQVVVIPTGGTPNYTFVWSTGCTTPSCNNICAGTYNVTVTDLNGCTATSTSTVTEPTAINIITSTIDAHCNAADGSATSLSSGGTGTLTPVWYLPATPGANLNNVVAGSYYVVVTDANGCDDTANVVINNIPGVVATAGPITPVSCFGGNNGAASVTTTGGTGIITYSWSCSPSITNAATNLVAGTCTVTVSDSAGCTSTVNFTINQPTDLTITSTATPNAICIGQNSNLSGLAAGGTPGYTYAWMPGLLAGQNQTVSPSNTTTYSVVVMDANGCVDSSTVTVTVSPNPVAILSGDTLAGCAPRCVNFSDNSTIGSGTITSWSWDFGDGSPLSTSQNPSHCYLSSGTYAVTLTVSTATGCSATIVMPNYIQVFANPVAAFTAGPQPTTELNPTINFVDGSTNAATWDWSFGDLLNSASTVQNPSFTYPGNGCFNVVLTVTTINGCIDTAVQQVCIDPDVTLFVPNAFTPNGDGVNEVFYPQQIGMDPDHFEMWIFDRWGNMIFYTDDLAKGWDGSVQGKGGDLAQIDTYVWKIKAKDLLGNKHNIIGHVSLIR